MSLVSSKPQETHRTTIMSADIVYYPAVSFAKAAFLNYKEKIQGIPANGKNQLP